MDPDKTDTQRVREIQERRQAGDGRNTEVEGVFVMIHEAKVSFMRGDVEQAHSDVDVALDLARMMLDAEVEAGA